MKARLFIPVLVTALAACLGGCGDQAQDGTLRDKLRELEDSHQETQAELARLLCEA